jgi:hypothetical protein
MSKSINVPITEDSVRLFLKSLAVGQKSRTPNDLGTVKHFDRNTWNLFQDGDRDRSRWGDLEQMTEDLLYFETYGTLPPQDMPRW